MATANEVLYVVAAAVVGVADLYEHTYPEKTVLLDVWFIKDFHSEAHDRGGQAVGWVAPNRLDQFEFPEANHGIIKALNI